MEIEVGGIKVKLYSSKETMPITKFHKFNKMLMVDADIGADMGAVHNRLSKISQYNDKDMKIEVAREIENLRQCFHNVDTGYNPKHLSFACIVQSIDGIEVIGEDNGTLIDTLTKLNEKGLTQGDLEKYINEVKKKLSMN